MDEENLVSHAVQRIVARAAFQALTQHTHLPRFPTAPPDDWNFVYEPVQREFSGVIPTIFRIVKISTQITVLLSISSISYFLFYHAVMPTHYATKQLFFDYTQPYNPAMHTKTIKRIRKEDECRSPWAAVDLFAKQSTWEAKYLDVLPEPIITNGRLLDAKQHYFIETLLTLPESFVNQQVGMFGVVTELRAANGTLLAVSRRSTRIPYQSQWIRTIFKGLFLIPYLLGAWDEVRTVVVPSYRHFVESQDLPLQHVVVRLEPQASVIAEIVGGEIRVGKEMNVFQELLKERFYTCFMIGTLMFAGYYILQWHVLRLAWVSIRQRFCHDYVEDELDLDLEFDDAELFPDDEKPGDEGEQWEDFSESPSPRRNTQSSWEDIHVSTQATIDDSSFVTPPQPGDVIS